MAADPLSKGLTILEALPAEWQYQAEMWNVRPWLRASHLVEMARRCRQEMCHIWGYAQIHYINISQPKIDTYLFIWLWFHDLGLDLGLVH